MSALELLAPGLANVQKVYAAESKRLAKAQRKALLAAARPIKMEAKRQAPYLRGGWSKWRKGERGKPLHTTITSKVYEDPFTGTKVKIRSSSRIAHLVILGTAAHDEPKGGGTSKAPMPFGDGRFARRVRHPGAKANDFLGRAMAMSREAAIAAYRESLFPGGRVP